MLRDDFGKGVGLEFVEDIAGGGFEEGAIALQFVANAVFGVRGMVGGIFHLGLALDVMDFGEQIVLGGGLAVGVVLCIQGGLAGVAGVLAHVGQILAKLGHEGGREDEVVLQAGKHGGIAGHAIDGIGVADFGELGLVQQAAMLGGFSGPARARARARRFRWWW